MKTAGKWITWISVIVVLGSVVGGVWLAASGFVSLLGGTTNQLRLSGPDNSIEQEFEAGTEWQFFTYGANGVYVGPVPNCSMDAGPAEVRPGNAIRTSITVGAESRISFASVVFVESGTYRFSCDQSGVTMGQVSGLGGLGDSLSIFGGMTLLTTGLIFGVFGLIIGVMLWMMGASRDRRSAPHQTVTGDTARLGIIESKRQPQVNPKSGATFH